MEDRIGTFAGTMLESWDPKLFSLAVPPFHRRQLMRKNILESREC